MDAAEQPPDYIRAEDGPPSRENTTRLTLDTREQTLIVLLMAGHTDASAARRLRVSTRTVTNILRGLMDRLSVDNRFQLGIALGGLGIRPRRPETPRKAS